MIDPETLRAAFQRYYSTTPPQEILDDLRRFSPELARRFGVTEHTRIPARRKGVRAWFGALGRTVHRLVS